ncbi:MAG: response regulator [Thaumarchaeota archaeon]|nr:response regulator [Nitrososphaerota archaeon]
MSNPKQILLVDDDYDFLESLQLLLMDDGHEVIPVSNGKDAVEKYIEFEPDLVLLDIRMPGIDGYETFLHVIKHDPNARVIFTSAYAIGNKQYQNAKDLSLSGILSKPIEFAKLRQMITIHAR